MRRDELGFDPEYEAWLRRQVALMTQPPINTPSDRKEEGDDRDQDNR